jgi:prevent-host-death family protein
MLVTSASNLRKRIGEFSDIARRKPVVVTRRGRPMIVLISVESYEQLRRIEQHITKTIKVAELPKRTTGALKTATLSHLPAD